jgi:hypothetical protein
VATIKLIGFSHRVWQCRVSFTGILIQGAIRLNYQIVYGLLFGRENAGRCPAFPCEKALFEKPAERLVKCGLIRVRVI